MDERLVYANRRSLRRSQLGAGAAILVAVVLVAAWGFFELTAFDGLVLASIVIAGMASLVVLERRIKRPLPELRLSSDGLEGAFGRIAWTDIVGVSVKLRFRLYTRRVVVRVHRDVQLLEPTCELADVGPETQEIFRDRLELDARHLELGPHALARELERFRLYYASP